MSNNELTLKHLEELPDPRVTFNMVMLYADATGKNPWECMAYVFTNLKHTVTIWHDNKLVGYINTEVIDNNELFINHAFVKYPVEDRPLLLDDMIRKIGIKLGTYFPKATMSSEQPERLWLKWGFEKSNMIIYEREVK